MEEFWELLQNFIEFLAAYDQENLNSLFFNMQTLCALEFVTLILLIFELKMFFLIWCWAAGNTDAKDMLMWLW